MNKLFFNSDQITTIVVVGIIGAVAAYKSKCHKDAVSIESLSKIDPNIYKILKNISTKKQKKD